MLLLFQVQRNRFAESPYSIARTALLATRAFAHIERQMSFPYIAEQSNAGVFLK